jgi:hypothetical protein
MTEHASTSAPQLINENVDIHRFELTSAFDIAHALRQLMNKHDLVAIYFDHGTQFTLSTILDVDAKGHTFTIDQSGSPEINRKLITSERNICVATPEGIKYQFVCGKLREVKTQPARRTAGEPANQSDQAATARILPHQDANRQPTQVPYQ